MDYDSSSKFISSLAKFLQSLCNGYVEFDNGVEVIGHIYLSVDTGKKIDYILNEKVCKTDENSVTFISNSFHAQPAEKPKPNAKKGKSDHADDKTDVVEVDNNDSSQVEPKSTNLGTVPRNSNRHPYSPSQRQGKRPFSPHSKSNSSPGSKRSKGESQEHGEGLMSGEGNLSTPSPASDPLRGFTQGSANFPPESNYSQSYDQGFHPSLDNSFPEESEERDVKPSMDTDVTFVKEEFTSSNSQLEDDGNQGGDTSYSSLYHSSSYSGEGPSNQSFGQQNSRFGGGGDRSDAYDPAMRSHMDGNGADASVTQGDSANWPINPLQSERPIEPSWFNHKPFLGDAKSVRFGKSCKKCGFSSRDNMEMSIHKKNCKGKRHLTCCVCSKVLSRYDALAEHLRGIHGIGRKVACRFCGKGFKYKPQVYQHQIICPQRPDIHAKLLSSSMNHVSDSSFLCPTKSSPPHLTAADVKPILSFSYDPQVS